MSDSSVAPDVSVVIPVRNEAAKIQKCIEGILGQSIRVREIVVVDSGSTDATLEILKQYPGVVVIPIRSDGFNHGDARNIGVRAAKGKWVLLTVGDSYPADELWIERLFSGVVDDEVAAVCGAQVVPHHADANPVEWFRPISEPELRRLQFQTAAAFDSLPPLEKVRACGWDDVTALYRRDVLLRLPFQPVMYAEDALWSLDALRTGHALVYNPAARVHHYHIENADFIFHRTIITLCFKHRIFGYLYDRPALVWPMLRVVKRLTLERSLTMSQRVRWAKYNLNLHLATRAAVDAFNAAVARGSRATEMLCGEYSDRPPIPGKAQVASEAMTLP